MKTLLQEKYSGGKRGAHSRRNKKPRKLRDFFYAVFFSSVARPISATRPW
jgi:hypothetical protein